MYIEQIKTLKLGISYRVALNILSFSMDRTTFRSPTKNFSIKSYLNHADKCDKRYRIWN